MWSSYQELYFNSTRHSTFFMLPFKQSRKLLVKTNRKKRGNKMNRRQKIIVSITGIFIVLLALVGLTYAYFLTRITGNENEKSISVTTANLELVYAEEDDEYIIGKNDGKIEPGYNNKSKPKTFTVTNNGNKNIDSYAVILENVETYYASTFTITGEDGNPKVIEEKTPVAFKNPEDFKLTITCSSKKQGEIETTNCNGMTGKLPLMESVDQKETYITNGILLTNSIEVGEVQTYSVVLEYIETKEDQSADMNKMLNGKFNIIDTKNTIDIKGIVNDFELGDKIVTNSTRRESQINSDGSYKIVGLEADVHSIKLNDKEIGKVSIIKGETTNVGTTTQNGVTIPQITITDDSRTVNISIPNENEVNVDNYIESFNPYNKGTLAYNIINNAISARDTNNSELAQYSPVPKTKPGQQASTADEKTLSITQDDYGNTYYFRGSVTNNYINYSGMCWRIVRIQGDGTVKLALADEDHECGANVEPNADGSYSGYSTENNSSAFATTTLYSQVMPYIGTQITVDNFKNLTYENSNNIVHINRWIEERKLDLSNLSITNYCNELAIHSTENPQENYTIYVGVSRKRLRNNTKYGAANPTLKCSTKGIDSTSSLKYNSNIAIITADELAFSGASYDLASSTYLKTNATAYKTWTMTNMSIDVSNNITPYFFVLTGDGVLDSWVPKYENGYVRPVITLKTNLLSTGTGTQADPYKIISAN